MILDWSKGRLGCFIAVLDAETGDPVPPAFLVRADDGAGAYWTIDFPATKAAGRLVEAEHRRPVRFEPKRELGDRPVPPATRALAALMLERLRAGEDPKWSEVVMASRVPRCEVDLEWGRVGEWIDEGMTILVRAAGADDETPRVEPCRRKTAAAGPATC